MSIKLPTARFRTKSVSTIIELYRLYIKRNKDKQFFWYSEFRSKEEADAHGKRLEQEASAKYIIRKIVVTYQEDLCGQSFSRELKERLPEIAGIV